MNQKRSLYRKVSYSARGRPLAYPKGVNTIAQQIVLSDRHMALAKFIGGGVVTKGLRAALELAALFVPETAADLAATMTLACSKQGQAQMKETTAAALARAAGFAQREVPVLWEPPAKKRPSQYAKLEAMRADARRAAGDAKPDQVPGELETAVDDFLK